MQTLSSLTSCPLSLRVRASWDTQQMISYNPNAPRKPPKKTPPPPPPTVTLTASTARMIDSISQLLKRHPPGKPTSLFDGYAL